MSANTSAATLSGSTSSGNRELIRKFAEYYRPHRGLFALDFTCAVLSGMLELAFPMAVGLFVDQLLPGQNWALILVASVALLVTYLVNTGLMVVVNYWGHMLGINIETEMRRRSFDHLQKLSFRFYDNHKTGHLVARVTKDLEEIGEVAHHGPEDLFIAIMTFIGAFVLMFWVNPTLALITGVIVPISAVISIRYGGRMTRTWRMLFSRVGEFNARIEENVGGMRVVQAFANEDHERNLFADDNARYRDDEAGGVPADGDRHVAQLLQHAAHATGGDDRRRISRVARSTQRGRVRQLPAAGWRLFPPGGEDQRGA